MIAYLWLGYLILFLFMIGCAIGSFLNVCIARLPEGRSLVWPSSHCFQCKTPIRLRDNIPLLSYWLLGGKCRVCKASFSMRYFWIELATGFGFVSLFLLEVGWNIHRIPAFGALGFTEVLWGQFPRGSLELLTYHLLMFCLLLVAWGCQVEHGRVPQSVGTTGLLVGLLGATLMPWPWPTPPLLTLQTANSRESLAPGIARTWLLKVERGRMPVDQPWHTVYQAPCSGVAPWPVWGPLPAGLRPSSWQLGLATGLAGALTGLFIAMLFAWIIGRGAGAPALLMGAGSMLGWQVLWVAAGWAVLLAGWGWVMCPPLRRVGGSALLAVCWGPALLLAWLGWPWFGAVLYPLFFDPNLLLGLVIVTAAWLLLAFLLGRTAKCQSMVIPASPYAAGESADNEHPYGRH